MNYLCVICEVLIIFMIEYILFMLVTNIWYLLVGMCMKYDITSFSFAGFMVKEDNGKYTILIVPIRFTAVVSMTRKETSGKIKIIFESVSMY